MLMMMMMLMVVVMMMMILMELRNVLHRQPHTWVLSMWHLSLQHFHIVGLMTSRSIWPVDAISPAAPERWLLGSNPRKVGWLNKLKLDCGHLRLLHKSSPTPVSLPPPDLPSAAASPVPHNGTHRSPLPKKSQIRSVAVQRLGRILKKENNWSIYDI